MREIKFRAWDGGYMLDSGNISEHYISDLNGHFKAVMQYTGLKDKNGKEIYEGDVVRAYNFTAISYVPKEKTTGMIKYVKWLNVSFVFERHEKDSNGRTLASSDCEVIGNIYENPELLNPEEDKCMKTVKEVCEAYGISIDGRTALENLFEQLEQEIEELKDFAIWMTGCGYDFTSLDHFNKMRDKLLKDPKEGDKK